MKKLAIALIVVLLINTINVYGYTIADTSAIDYVNNLREHLDIPILKSDESLMQAAENHSIYLNTYEKNANETSHIQDKDKELFTGLYPWDRVAYFNYNNNENPYTKELIYIANITDTLTTIFNKMIDDPDLRVEILNPKYKHIGYHQEGNKFVVELGGPELSKEVLYPFNRQEKVPYQWEHEGNNYGYPVTYTIYSTTKIVEMSFIRGNEPTIINKENSEIIDVEVRIESDSSSQSIVILPKDPLDINTEYEVAFDVKLTYSDDIKSFKHIKSSFKTGSNISINRIDKREKIKRQEFAEHIISESNIKLIKDYENTFADVPSESIYAAYIYTLKELGIMRGYSGDEYGYDDYLTREQAFVISMRLYDYLNQTDYETMEIQEEPNFSDIDNCSTWSIDAIRSAYNLGIVKGTTEGTLMPKEYLTFLQAEIIAERITNSK